MTTTATAPGLSTGLLSYDEALEEEIFAFQRETYPHRDPDLIPKRWRWMYVASAQRLGTSPYVWTYRDATSVLAHQGAIAVRVQIGDDTRTTGWFVETMTREAVRGTTIGPAVIMKAKQDLPLNLSLGQTREMRELQFRLGWQQVAPLENWVLPVQASKMLRGKLPHPAFAQIAAGALKSRELVRRTFAGRKAAGIEIREIERFNESHNELWEAVRGDYPCAVVRDASYLNWKYVQQPGQRFHKLELRRAGQPCAVAVLMFRDADAGYSYRRGYLVDVIAPAKDRPLLLALIHAARNVCRAQDAAALFFPHICRHWRLALRSFGFLKREATRYFLISPGDLDGEQKQKALDPQRWLITLGDSDIDRPW